MQLTRKLKSEILKVYHAYWDGYLKGDVKGMAPLLAEEYTQVGSAETEVFDTKRGAVKFLRDTINQVAGRLEMRNRRIRIELQDNLVLVQELCDVYVFADREWMFYSKFRASTLMQEANKRWKIVHQHSSFPDARTGEGENIATEKIAAENQQLREAVKRRTIELEQKSHELEIETTLQRVRAIAMGMKEPVDMLEVCKTISLQLESLGVKEIRNVQTAIFYESRSTYMNYEYYSRHNKTIVTETTYTNHKVHKAFATKMLKGKGEVFVTHIKGKKVKDWIAYQKTTNVFIDRFLEKASSLNYYWHSLGPVALGISTYVPLSKEDLSLFRRFLNVFELAYTRYLDIEQAHTQARESQIQASLEKVRAQALGMRKPEGLPDVCEVLFKELQTLGFSELRNTMVNIHNDEQRTFLNYDYSDEIGKSITPLFYDIHPVIEKQINQIRSARDAFSESVFTGEDLAEWKKFRKRSGEKDDPRIRNTTALHYYLYSIGTGSIGISTFSSIGEEKHELLKRFRNVFDFAYKRYMDVAQAETHARESQIELSLERVRARSMAMHKSDELVEAADVVFQQLHELGIESIRAGIATFDAVKETITVWSRAHADSKKRILGVAPRKSHPFFVGCFDAWKAKEEFYFMEFVGNEVVEYYRHMSSILSYPASKTYSPKEVFYTFFFPEGSVNVVRQERLTDDELGIMQRFARVFGLMYRRFLDLQRAEAQAREAQIETALERVRSRSMAMQKSEELKDVIKVVYQQLTHLKLKLDHSGFVVDYTPGGDWHFWIADERDIPSKITHPYFESVWAHQFNEAKEKGAGLFATHLTFEEKNKFYNELLSYVPGLPEASKEFYLSCPGLAASTVLLDNVGLYIENFSGTPYTDEENKLLMRFGRVFQQTYTRFLDLQKAEAQSREAQIELALERVRARTMAMQKSEELAETAHVLFEQFKELDKAPKMLTIGIMKEIEGLIEFWVTDWSGDGSKVNRKFNASIDEPTLLKKIFAAWKEQKKSTVIELVGKELQDWIDYRVKLSGIPDNNDYSSRRGFVIAAFFSKGMLSISAYEPRPPETVQLLERFAGVFDLTYTRFLDLQKAEVQAREARIEASLEKVRARTMGMQRSDELKEAAALLFQQVQGLGGKALSCGYNIWGEDEGAVTSWMSSSQGNIQPPMRIPLTEDSFYKNFYNAKQSGETFYVEEVSGKKLEDERKYLATVPGFQESLDASVRAGYPLPTLLIHHLAFFSQGFLLFITLEPCPELWDIFKRFAVVFEQTYTRFLDLKRAEAQAKEAQIEAALERVRSKAMAMHTSGDLSVTVSAVFSELRKLGIETIRTGVALYSKDRPAPVYYASTTAGNDNAIAVTGSPDPSAHPCLSLQHAAWRKQQNYFPVLGGAELKSYYSVLSLQHPVKGETIEQFQHTEYGYYLSFSEGNFYAWSLKPCTEDEINILTRFKTIVDLTFRRYFDIEKAEAQARESQIEASLERVRSRTLAMQKSDELAETSAVLFRQLIALGINPNRLYIAIIKDDSGNVEFWITDEDGSKVSSAFTANLQHNRSWKKMFEGWMEETKSITIDMQGEELEEYFNHLNSLNVPFKGGLSQKRRVQTVAYFSKGFIGMASPDEQPEEASALLERFAAVFNLTFTRFNDLKLAEAQAHQAHLDLIQLQTEKRRAEDALTELSATQAQLVQQEKLASLGQLTAGIAHEIKNPLNFVNNFSSVSVELVDEAIEEIKKFSGNGGDARQLLDDVKKNLNKIIEHGARADGIVKSMLQHSRGGSSRMEPTDLNALIKEYVNLAFHGMRASKNPMNVDIQLDLDKSVGNASLKAEDFSRVIINLCQNAFDAMREKVNARDKASGSYLPKLTVRTRREANRITVQIEDNGPGIPDGIKEKVLQPFFTTKKGTQGTGLGLSITNDIVKAHGGEMKIESNGGGGAAFIILLPTETLK